MLGQRTCSGRRRGAEHNPHVPRRRRRSDRRLQDAPRIFDFDGEFFDDFFGVLAGTGADDFHIQAGIFICVSSIIFDVIFLAGARAEEGTSAIGAG